MKLPRRNVSVSVVIALVAILSVCPLANAARNVIVMIPDGVSQAQFELASAVAEAEGVSLSLDRMERLGVVVTASASSEITDSAAAATAIATGVATNNDWVAVAPDGSELRTVLEMAEERGMRTGLITTVMLFDATPAAFGAHTESRRNYTDIAAALLDREIEVLFGGGRALYEDSDLLGRASQLGYDILRTAGDLNSTDAGRTLGLFAAEAMAYELDRDQAQEPSLAQMTRKALELLDGSEGFFLMVEGGKIDWAGHRGDAAAVAHDLLAFDDALDVALEYADTVGETLVVVVPDHETGGMAIPDDTLSSAGDFFGDVTSSAARIAELLSANRENIESLIASRTPIEQLSSGEIARIRQAPDGYDPATYRWEPDSTIAEIVSSYGGVTFSTSNHSSAPVPVFAYGAAVAQARQLQHLTDVGDLLIQAIQDRN